MINRLKEIKYECRERERERVLRMPLHESGFIISLIRTTTLGIGNWVVILLPIGDHQFVGANSENFLSEKIIRGKRCV